MHCYLNYPFRGAHESWQDINHSLHVRHTLAKLQLPAVACPNAFFFFFAHQPVLFVVPVSIRLMEYRAAASVPLTPHPSCLL